MKSNDTSPNKAQPAYGTADYEQAYVMAQAAKDGINHSVRFYELYEHLMEEPNATYVITPFYRRVITELIAIDQAHAEPAQQALAPEEYLEAKLDSYYPYKEEGHLPTVINGYVAALALNASFFAEQEALSRAEAVIPG